jgi:DMSO/TMAO reductase YedYZ molybdopterin-dependent catalytic subunit
MDDTLPGRRGYPGLDRRAFLRGTAATLPLAAVVGGLALPVLAGDDTPLPDSRPGYPGIIVRQSQPENYEFPFPTLNSFATPNNLFYVRTHFGIFKDVDLRTWRLKIEGRVERPLELSYDDLLQMPSRTQVALLECSGNSRVFLVPKAEGVPWELGAVSNADWTGVPLEAVLDRAKLKSDAVEVVCEGADSGELPATGRSRSRRARYTSHAACRSKRPASPRSCSPAR